MIIGLDEPTAMTFTPDGRMLIAERDGTVWVVQPGATQVSPTPFLQLPSVATDNERGLLGITVDPAFAPNGYVYALLHARLAAQPRVALHRHRQHARRLERVRGLAEHRQRRRSGTRAATCTSGPTATSTSRSATTCRARPPSSSTSYNGKILRVTRDGAVPADNPFNDGAGPNLDAIWVRGLRNPFRFTIDPPTGRMIIGDVGEGTTRGGQRRRRAAPTTAGRRARARAAPPA